MRQRSEPELPVEVTEQEATVLLITSVQRAIYDALVQQLKDGQYGDHVLSSLDPFLDNRGVLRVGGRLKDTLLAYELKHPIIIPRNHELATLIIRHFHELTQHQGRHLTLGAIRSAGYYIEKGSRMIRKYIATCVTCRKLRGGPAEQMMAPLPQPRVEDTAPFHHTGTDTFGPYIIAESKTTRQTKGTKKMWGIIFTCMASRAIHIEPLTGLDISSLANALRRFIAIRGTCAHIYSDQGTNYTGMANQEGEFFKTLQDELAIRGVTWHFNPPRGSHFGGVWERKVGAFKRVLDGALMQLKGRLLNRDELTTLFSETMAIVNGTPMWEVSGDPSDPLPISPSMLLTLKCSLPSAPIGDLTATDVAAYGPKRWRRAQYLADCFWQRWRLFYLSELQERSKWLKRKTNIEPGDLVLLRNKNEKRNLWPTGVVVSAKRSSDNLVRTVSIETGKANQRRVLVRPISEVTVLIPRK